MEEAVKTRIKRLRRSMSLTGAIVALSVGVILPVLLSTSTGIVAIAIGQSSDSTVFGVLIISFTAAAVGSAIVVTILLGRRNRTARLQADFVSNITHELRTPLTAIRMYAQTLQMGLLKDDPTKTAESLETILRETEWLETMIDRVLTWRAVAKDREEPEMKKAPLCNSVSVALVRFERMIAHDEVQLLTEFDEEASVFHNEDGIVSITLNLLINAYKYTAENKKIKVKITSSENHVELLVKDNGIGIAANEIGKIFDPFYRVDSRLRQKASGAGLGLAIVRHQVDLHNAEVFVESRVDKGTTFIVRFTIKEEQY